MVGIVHGEVGPRESLPLLVERRLLHQSVAQFTDFSGTTDRMVARVEHLELERCALLERDAKSLGQPQFGSFSPCVLEQILIAHDCDTTKLVP